MTNYRIGRAAARTTLILMAVMAGILNGSPLAAPVLLFAVYLVTVLVRQGQAAVNLIEEERAHLARARALAGVR